MTKNSWDNPYDNRDETLEGGIRGGGSGRYADKKWQRGKTPQSNVVQNKQFNDAVKTAENKLGHKLSKDQRRQLHDRISKQGYGYHDIIDEALAMFGTGSPICP